MIRHGFGIILSNQSGELHPSYYLDKMMTHLNSKYYLGLLSAAAYWGASHQSIMSYQVISEKGIKPIKFENSKVEFITKKMSFPEIGLLKVAGVGGYFLVSSPELTAVDILRFPKKSGHLNNIATILEDLVEKWEKKRLLEIFKGSHVPTVSLQRLGFLLDVILNKQTEASWIEKILEGRMLAPSILSISRKKEKNKSYPFNNRWKLYVNTEVEPD